MTYLLLFWEFFKTGLFAIGGGMATIPFLYNMSDATGWFTHEDLANMIAVGESTPGPIGVNMATYVGYITGLAQSGNVWGALLGAVVATLGLITPSIVIVLLVALALKKFQNSKLVQNAFYGLRPASTGLIAAAGISVIITTMLPGWTVENGFSWSFLNWKGLILAAVLWALTNVVKPTKKLHPILFILFSAGVGIAFGL